MRAVSVARLIQENVVVFAFDDLVTLTSDRREACALENRKSAAGVPDQVLLLKRAGRFVYALAPHSQHVRQEFLGELKLARLHSVMSHQQPAGKTSVYRMVLITGGSLGDLCQS